jgi:hypothetical protein
MCCSCFVLDELLVEYHEYHSNFEQTLSKRCRDVEHDVHRTVTRTTMPETSVSYRLCYSLHSSFVEIADVLQTLRPRRVTPIAVPLATQITSKRLFHLIEHFIAVDRTQTCMPSIRLNYLRDVIQRKSSCEHIQLKHRYESFESRIDRKRRRKLFDEQQQREMNDAELVLNLNEKQCEDELLRRVHRLSRSIRQLNQRILSTIDNNDVLVDRSIDEKTSLSFVSSRQIHTTNEPSPMNINDRLPDERIEHVNMSDHVRTIEYACDSFDRSILSSNDDQQRTRTSSDASSDTVDYEFIVETPILAN